MNQIASKSFLKQEVEGLCYHCGDACTEVTIRYEQKSFCCEGCKMVYTILQENDLGRFYDLNQAAGFSQKNLRKRDYAYLDDPDTVEKLLEFREGHQVKFRVFLPQIHCSSCLWLLENLPRLHTGITYSRVDFLAREALICFDDSQITLRELATLLDRIGYPPEINLNDLEHSAKSHIDKTLYYQLGLAGFAFGNIMLLSFPEYLGLDVQQDTTLFTFFGYLNIALILPVVFYSGRDYLRSAWQGLRQRRLNIDVPVSLGILALFLRSVFEIISQSGAGYLDSLAGLIFFLLIGKWFQKKTYAKITFDRDYKSYFPIACTLKKDGKEQSIPLDKISVGDILLIRHGELIPADAILVRGAAEVDYSFVSGESEPLRKAIGSQLYAGGRQMGEWIEIKVSRKVSNSYLTQLWNEDTFTKDTENGTLSDLADRVAKFFTVFILSVATATLIYWLPQDMGMAINAFTAVLIIACPCAVALSIPFTFGNVLRLLARQHIYLKNTQIIEALAKIDQVVFDKTGTITYTHQAQVTYEGETLSETERAQIYSLVYHSIHPLSQRIRAYFRDVQLLPVTTFREHPGKGLSAIIAGQPVRIGSVDFIEGQSPELTIQKSVLVEIDGKIVGAFNFQAHYRNGLRQVLDQIKTWANIALISGDNDREKTRLQTLFDWNQDLLFQQTPQQKLQYIQNLQDTSQKVAMIGDGLNDAGALQQSDVGIVITESASNFTPACDVIMDARQFHRLPDLFTLARKSIRVVYAAYLIALLYNIIGLSYAVQGSLSPVIAAILMPLSSVSIVLFGVGVSSWLVYRKGLFKTVPDEKNYTQ